MPTKDTSQIEDEKFYNDLDKERAHGSCCTCYTISLLFSGLLIFLLLGSFYLYKQITSERIFPLGGINRTSLKDLTNRLDSLSVGEAGQVSIELSEPDFNAIVSGGLSVQNFVLKDEQTVITPSEIIVYGSLVKPLSSKVVIGLVPAVENEKVKFKVKSVQTGKLKIPKLALGQVENNLNQLLETKLSLIYTKMVVEEVSLSDKMMLIKGKLK